uniref:Uncharacterized protein n=1 Tax=Kalanchoe fedtschenkoi TaxID=63787 RepID=A0A7N0ZUZ8_KALFE
MEMKEEVECFYLPKVIDEFVIRPVRSEQRKTLSRSSLHQFGLARVAGNVEESLRSQRVNNSRQC